MGPTGEPTRFHGAPALFEVNTFPETGEGEMLFGKHAFVILQTQTESRGKD